MEKCDKAFEDWGGNVFDFLHVTFEVYDGLAVRAPFPVKGLRKRISEGSREGGNGDSLGAFELWSRPCRRAGSCAGWEGHSRSGRSFWRWCWCFVIQPSVFLKELVSSCQLNEGVKAIELTEEKKSAYLLHE